MLFRQQKNMKKNTLLLFLLLPFLLLLSCNKSTVFEQTVTFPNANWAFEEKAVNFEVPITGSDKPHSLTVELDLVGNPNVDMFYATFIIITPSGGKTVKSILFNFINPKEPYIMGNNPNEKIYRLNVYPKRFFTETGIYAFEINQFSNKADNYGIRALRLHIEKVKEKKI